MTDFSWLKLTQGGQMVVEKEWQVLMRSL